MTREPETTGRKHQGTWMRRTIQPPCRRGKLVEGRTPYTHTRTLPTHQPEDQQTYQGITETK